MQDEQLIAWDRLVETVYKNPYIPVSETFPSKRQVEFLAYDGPECLFGGSAGGGKTVALLAAALQYVQVPGYSALIIRRTYRHLMQDGGLIQKSREWIGTKAHWRDKSMSWTFEEGSTLTFGYLDQYKDTMLYQGGAWPFIGVDELSQLHETWYQYLFSRMRKPDWVCKNCKSPLERTAKGFSHKNLGTCKEPDPVPHKMSPYGLALPDVPIRMRAGSNPGGPLHEYLKRRFVVPGAPKKFIPSRLDDNPGLNKEEYVKSLSELDPITKAQLLQGDWNAYQGGRFKREWFREFWVDTNRLGHPVYRWNNKSAGGKGTIRSGWPTCPEDGIPVSQCWNFITVDPAARSDESADYTVIGVFAVTPRGEILILEIVRGRSVETENGPVIERFALEEIVPNIRRLCDEYNPMFVGMEDAGFQIGIVQEGQRSLGVPVQRLSPEGKPKLTRATPAIIRASEGQIFLPLDEPEGTHPWIPDFVSECVQFTGDEKEDAYNDQVDVLAWAVFCLCKHGLAAPIVIQPEADLKVEQSIGIFMSKRKQEVTHA